MKKNSILTIIIVILSLVIVGLIGYITYDKMLSKKDNNTTSGIVKENNDTDNINKENNDKEVTSVVSKVKLIYNFTSSINSYMPSIYNDIKETTIIYGDLKLKAKMNEYEYYDNITNLVLHDRAVTYDIYYKDKKIERKNTTVEFIDRWDTRKQHTIKITKTSAYSIDSETILIIGEEAVEPKDFSITMFDEKGKILFEDVGTGNGVEFNESTNELTYSRIDFYLGNLYSPTARESYCDLLYDLSTVPKYKDAVLARTLKYRYENHEMKLIEETKYTVADLLKENNCE